MAIEELPPGTMLCAGDYEIKETIGRGGFGITYKAVDLNLGNLVAIKEYAPEDFAERAVGALDIKDKVKEYEWGLRSFRQEGETLASFTNNPSIVSVLRFSTENNTAYLVMEYIDGPDVSDYSKTITSPAQVENLLEMLRVDLKVMHEAGFIHRDLKPENILIRATNDHPVLIDFGSSRQQSADRTMALVTPYYSPVEQYASDTPHGPYTDIYSLSATFYRVITGKTPPDGPSRILDDQCKKLAGDPAFSAYSPDFLAQIDAGMIPLPASRPQNVDEWTQIRHGGEVKQAEPIPEAVHNSGGGNAATDQIKAPNDWIQWAAGAAVLVVLGVLFYPSGPDEKPNNPIATTIPEQVIPEKKESVGVQPDSDMRWVVGVDGRDWTPIGLADRLTKLPRGKDYGVRFDAKEAFRVKTDQGLAVSTKPGRNFGRIKGELYLKNVTDLPQQVTAELYEKD